MSNGWIPLQKEERKEHIPIYVREVIKKKLRTKLMCCTIDIPGECCGLTN